MISESKIVPVARILKTHGIQGELNCETDIDYECFAALPCLFVLMDGLYVPFYVASLRRRGTAGVLLRFEGVGDSTRAAAFTGKVLYAEADKVPSDDDNDGGDGFYVEDLIGCNVIADGVDIGVIEDYDDTTSNMLLMVRMPDKRIVHIPAADEFFEEIDLETRSVRLTLPEGLVDLND